MLESNPDVGGNESKPGRNGIHKIRIDGFEPGFSASIDECVVKRMVRVGRRQNERFAGEHVEA